MKNQLATTVCIEKRNTYPDYAVVITEDGNKYKWSRSSATYSDMDEYLLHAKLTFEGKGRKYFHPFDREVDYLFAHHY